MAGEHENARGDLHRAVANLEAAAVAVDSLWHAEGDPGSDEAMFSLGEASMAIHQALVALREWDVPWVGDGPAAALLDG